MCNEERYTGTGVRFLFATFRNYRHGGITVVYDSYRDLVAMFKAGRPPKPDPTPRRPPTPPKPPPDPLKALRRINTAWSLAVPLDKPRAAIGRTYLEARGLGELLTRGDFPADVRFRSHLEYWHPIPDSKPVMLGEFPALVALVRNVDGKVVGLHRTFIRPDGSGKAQIPDPEDAGLFLEAKKLLAVSYGATKGGAIRLYPAGPRLIVAEGIETTLACRVAAPQFPAWSALSAPGLAALNLPEEAGREEVIVMCDLDRSGAGEQAGEVLAQRLLKTGRRVKVVLPDEDMARAYMAKRGEITKSIDWLDVLNTYEDNNHG